MERPEEKARGAQGEGIGKDSRIRLMTVKKKTEE